MRGSSPWLTSFDALTTERPYKKAMTPEAALALLQEESGSHFAPACVDAFSDAFARIRGADASASPASPEPAAVPHPGPLRASIPAVAVVGAISAIASVAAPVSVAVFIAGVEGAVVIAAARRGSSRGFRRQSR